MTRCHAGGSTLGAAPAALIAWLGAGAVNAAVIAAVATPASSRVLRIVHHAWDFTQFVALGLMASAMADTWMRSPVRGRALTALAIAAVGGVVGALTLPPDLANFSARFGAYGPVVLVAGIVLVALGFGVAWLVGRWLARPIARWAAVLAALGGFIANGLVLQLDYPGGHLFVALYGASLAAAALTGARLPGALGRALERWRARRSVSWGPRALASLAAACVLVLAPPRRVGPELVRFSGSVLPPFLGQLREPDSGGTVHIPEEEREWFAPRDDLPPIAPSARRVMPDDGVVIFLSIDAARADLLTRPETAARLPTLARFRQSAVDFANARAPGTQTVYTITSIFSGTYFSQQYWTTAPFAKAGLWPHEDHSVRFPELLARAGIATVTFSAVEFLVNDWGCIRGFTEETRVRGKSAYAVKADELVSLSIERLQKAASGPLFLFVHFMDPHAPYDLAGSTGSPFERYLGEVAMVDTALDRFMKWLDGSPLAGRTTVIITSDHGEAFGEHNSTAHGHTMYDELLRVPLLVRAPSAEPHVVNDPVSLIDLGPTILDLMGQPTPATFMGQSIVPFLAGESPRLTRPILAEGRLKQTLVRRDGLKVIRDQRTATVELYDLQTDPNELRNLADDEERIAQPLALLRRFFDVHTYRKNGYRVPYRR